MKTKSRYIELEFMDIVKHDSKIICVHPKLDAHKEFHEPMLFNDFLRMVGNKFNAMQSKLIFQHGRWFIETLDDLNTLSIVIDMEKYKGRFIPIEGNLILDKEDNVVCKKL